MIRLLQLILLLSVTLCSVANTRISMITFYPGEEVYQLEGHTGLRVSDPESGTDIIYNWGLFDFNTPNFLYRFAKGRTDYRMGAERSDMVLPYYAFAGRKVVEQELDLDSAQTAAVLQALQYHLRYENVYRYNYVLDNCATRPLGIIRSSLGEGKSLELGAPINPTDNTFRKIMRRYHRNYPWYQFGIDLALGSGIDQPITPDMSAFAPTELEVMLQGATVGPDGRPLVKETRVLFDSDDATLGPTPWFLTPMAVSILLLVLSAGVFWASLYRRMNCLCNIFRSILFLIAGIAGITTTFLVFVSEHEATSPNWLLLWLNPLWFITLVFIWMRPRRFTVAWRYMQCILIAVCALLGVCSVQGYNAAFYPLMAATVLCTWPTGYSWRRG